MRGVVAIVSLLALASPARADRPPEPPRPPLDRECRKAFEVADYPKALECFKKAYLLLPAPALLYNMAHIERLMGDCVSASVHYRMFLDAKPQRAETVQLATQYLEECRVPAANSPVIRFLRSLVGFR